ncbi:MAG: hypothetical protein KatS3mg108_1204 [Isosphaeraceae bacterium]|jgi:hypothetical protein|nr:MAG: hypothetical protein KatS3mg108_1204 [Isosphaeraceae bacterium]
MSQALVLMLGALPLLSTNPPDTARIEGDYIESRTADVFTGPCFANAEVFITGHQALMAWKVRSGSWNGVDLSGRTVAAAIRANTTLSKDDPSAAIAVLIVDSEATPEQREALVAFAREMGGERLQNVQEIRYSLMNLFVEHEMSGSDDGHKQSGHHFGFPQAPKGNFWAPGLAEIATRPLDDTDHLCGNEVVEYPPLSKGVTAQPAYTLAHIYRGTGLGTRWDDRNCRGSFVGRFAY